MRRICLIALVLMTCACAHAAMSAFDPPDPRLDKKVTLDVNHTKLEDVAKSLSEQSGVTIKAGTGTRDWKVRERTVTIHAKDVTLGNMLKEVSGLLGYYVSREGKQDEWTYTVWQDKKARELEAEMITAEKEAAAQRVKDTRQAALDNAERALKMTAEEAMKLKDKDPMMAYMGGTKTGRGFANLLSNFGSQFPTEYDLMMRGKRSFIPVSGLPAGIQGAVKDALSGGLAEAFRREDKNAQQMAPYQIGFMPMDENQGGGLAGFSGMMFITGLPQGGEASNPSDVFGGGQPMTMFPIIAPGSGMSKLFGEAMLAVEAGESLQSVNERLMPKLQDADFLAEMVGKDSPTEKEPPTDPELVREIEIKSDDFPGGMSAMMSMGAAGANSQGKAVGKLAQILGWPVYLESFANTMPLSAFIKPGKQPVYRVLIAMEKAGYKWERGEGTLRVRPTDWATKRSHAIPESYMAFYRDRLEKEGQLNIDDVSAIAGSLTDSQIDHTFVADPDFIFLGGALSGRQGTGSRNLLRFYALLTPDQKEAVAVKPGLAFGQLTDAQWAYVGEFVSDRFGGIYVTDGSIFLKPQSEVETKLGSQSRAFEITVRVQDEKEPRSSTQAMYMPGKKQIADMRESRKKMEEQMKAAQQKQAEQSGQPAPSTEPAQAPQPAPAK